MNRFLAVIFAWCLTLCAFGQGTSYHGNFNGNGGPGPNAGQTGLTNIPLSALQQDGAMIGQGVGWTGTTWAPRTFSGGGGSGIYFNVTNYGASPTNTATANTVAFNATIAAYNAAGGGTLYAPAGVYLLNGGLLSTVSGTWRGDGAGNPYGGVSGQGTVFVNTSTTNSLIFNSASLFVTGILFSNSGFPTAGAFITTTNLSTIRVKTDVQWCGFVGGYIALDYLDGTSWTVQDNWFENMSYDYIRVNNRNDPDGADSFVKDNTFICAGEPCQAYVEIDGGGGDQITGNWMVGVGSSHFTATNGIWVNWQYAANSSEMLIENNYITATSSNGIYTCSPGGGFVQTFIVTGNDFNSYWTNNNYPMCATMRVGNTLRFADNANGASYSINPAAWVALSNISIVDIGGNTSSVFPSPPPYVVLDSGGSSSYGAMGMYDGQAQVYGPQGLIITNVGGVDISDILLQVAGTAQFEWNLFADQNIFQTNATTAGFAQQTGGSGSLSISQSFADHTHGTNGFIWQVKSNLLILSQVLNSAYSGLPAQNLIEIDTGRGALGNVMRLLAPLLDLTNGFLNVDGGMTNGANGLGFFDLAATPNQILGVDSSYHFKSESVLPIAGLSNVVIVDSNSATTANAIIDTNGIRSTNAGTQEVSLNWATGALTLNGGLTVVGTNSITNNLGGGLTPGSGITITGGVNGTTTIAASGGTTTKGDGSTIVTNTFGVVSVITNLTLSTLSLTGSGAGITFGSVWSNGTNGFTNAAATSTSYSFGASSTLSGNNIIGSNIIGTTGIFGTFAITNVSTNALTILQLNDGAGGTSGGAASRTNWQVNFATNVYSGVMVTNSFCISNCTGLQPNQWNTVNILFWTTNGYNASGVPVYFSIAGGPNGNPTESGFNNGFEMPNANTVFLPTSTNCFWLQGNIYGTNWQNGATAFWVLFPGFGAYATYASSADSLTIGATGMTNKNGLYLYNSPFTYVNYLEIGNNSGDQGVIRNYNGGATPFPGSGLAIGSAAGVGAGSLGMFITQAGSSPFGCYFGNYNNVQSAIGATNVIGAYNENYGNNNVFGAPLELWPMQSTGTGSPSFTALWYNSTSAVSGSTLNPDFEGLRVANYGTVIGYGNQTWGSSNSLYVAGQVTGSNGLISLATNVLQAGSANSWSGSFSTANSGWSNLTWGANARVNIIGTSGSIIFYNKGGVAGATACANPIWTNTVSATGSDYEVSTNCGVQIVTGVGVTLIPYAE